MSSQPPLTPDVERVLSRYLEIQAEQRRLNEEKGQLREALIAHLRDLRGRYWFPVVGGQKLMVSRQRSVDIDYDEALLQQRLGERYVRILKPDPRKLRRRLDDVAPYLEPVLAEIGSPHPERVRAAIESGVVTKEDFRGAFAKTVRHRVSVRRARDEDDGPP